MQVTKLAFPHVHAAFVRIEQDNGFHHYERVQGRACDYDKRKYEVPEPYDTLLVVANQTLSVMTEDELELICGEESEWLETVTSYDTDGEAVDRLLNAFFNEWQEDEEPAEWEEL